jgi:hypothetical protein|uniref:Uncharacterized protein n=1 Tax=Eutreptiella gymnastica TaxID=73025 RepID=A0A7S4LBV2_9EUGL|mmetsp:Transcript_42171/g.71353  ORF Transcript_42171/g.71353 Transcript_42171/m.71353 type:complete len:147 (+) Transcript_42171:147-587(+)
MCSGLSAHSGRPDGFHARHRLAPEHRTKRNATPEQCPAIIFQEWRQQDTAEVLQPISGSKVNNVFLQQAAPSSNSSSTQQQQQAPIPTNPFVRTMRLQIGIQDNTVACPHANAFRQMCATQMRMWPELLGPSSSYLIYFALWWPNV